MHTTIDKLAVSNGLVLSELFPNLRKTCPMPHGFLKTRHSPMHSVFLSPSLVNPTCSLAWVPFSQQGATEKISGNLNLPRLLSPCFSTILFLHAASAVFRILVSVSIHQSNKHTFTYFNVPNPCRKYHLETCGYDYRQQPYFFLTSLCFMGMFQFPFEIPSPTNAK